MHGTFVPKNFTVTHLTSLHFKTQLLHINHVSYLLSIPHLNSLACNYILNPLSKSGILQRKGASKPAGNWFQLLMALSFLVFHFYTFFLSSPLPALGSGFTFLGRFSLQHHQATRFLSFLPPPSSRMNPIGWLHVIWEPITAHTIRYIHCVPSVPSHLPWLLTLEVNHHRSSCFCLVSRRCLVQILVSTLIIYLVSRWKTGGAIPLRRLYSFTGKTWPFLKSSRCIPLCYLFVLFLVQQPPVGQNLLNHEDSRSNTMTHRSQ